MSMKEKDFFEMVKEWSVSKTLDKCEATVLETLEKHLLESLKKEMIKKIEAIESTNDMREFTLHCAEALLNDYKRDIKDKKEEECNKKK